MGKKGIETKNIVIVEDTNILIDLANTGLLAKSHNLDICFYTTDMVMHELKDSTQQSQVLRLKEGERLTVVETQGADLINVSLTYHQLTQKSNLSLPDVSVMLLAEKMGCRLLTSDQQLKKHARLRGIECNGLLWLTDRMVDELDVHPHDMAAYLQRLLDTNNRAPYSEVMERIDKYLRG